MKAPVLLLNAAFNAEPLTDRACASTEGGVVDAQAFNPKESVKSESKQQAGAGLIGDQIIINIIHKHISGLA